MGQMTTSSLVIGQIIQSADADSDVRPSSLTVDGDNPSDSSAEYTKQQHLPSRKAFKISLSVAKDLILISFALLGFISLVQPKSSNHADGAAIDKHHQAAPAFTSCDCGNSTAEAVQLGCKYDSLAAAWLPEHCRDDELTAEFERSGPGPGGKWTYWADGNHTQEISIEEIAKMADDTDGRFHMTGHWHVIHCIFYWRKEQRARFNGKIVEPRSYSEAHSKHCGKIFLDPGRDTIAGVALNTDAE
ncbi:hypothetical protein H634G_02591 [Metarhizium anisopliae BRIP 53293]|uniref:Uncharacterized protein n=1 Tax=Metarhizium anisopliae BRIP 53293 TaxID=1291518 RepID=A0A0D9P803_METAN|nr:hypothetical protein H634G_02591 [Metarhizium anisopliae BRIP 53293]KJK95182.1 hypothetical protein H633G_00921 [Metarhizium anisopliae BRIP 53284]